MKNYRKSLKSILALSLIGLFTFSACSKDDDKDQMPEMQSIVDVASSNSSFSILVDALVKADLVDALEGNGPFTVFAPTNEAFAALLEDLGVESLDDLSAEALKPILLYHVVSGKVLSSGLTDGYVPTLSEGPEASSISLQVKTGEVMLNSSARVTMADVQASNGVIHVIDKVLLPPTVVDLAISNPAFSILVQAVVKAELAETLSGAGSFTVFAPTNEAFQELFATLGVNGIADLTKEQLTPILLYHVVSGNVLSDELSTGNVSTLNGDIAVNVGATVTINGSSQVVLTDVQGSNGVVHVIDEVLLPPAK